MFELQPVMIQPIT